MRLDAKTMLMTLDAKADQMSSDIKKILADGPGSEISSQQLIPKRNFRQARSRSSNSQMPSVMARKRRTYRFPFGTLVLIGVDEKTPGLSAYFQPSCWLLDRWVAFTLLSHCTSFHTPRLLPYDIQEKVGRCIREFDVAALQQAIKAHSLHPTDLYQTDRCSTIMRILMYQTFGTYLLQLPISKLVHSSTAVESIDLRDHSCISFSLVDETLFDPYVLIAHICADNLMSECFLSQHQLRKYPGTRWPLG